MACDAPIYRTPGAGRLPRYCSAACRNRARYWTGLDSGKIKLKGPPPKAVRSASAATAARVRWGAIPEAERSAHAANLARARWGDHVPTARPTKQLRACPFCGNEVLMASNQRTCGDVACRRARNAERMREGGWMKARRAQEFTSRVELFTREQVYERDRWVCGICGGDVNSTLSHPDPMSASLDHKIPLSSGGSHTLDNVQCAHLTCNIAKGNRERARRTA